MEHEEQNSMGMGASGKERSGLKKERETKDDGRYIIFYSFVDEEVGESSSEEERAG